jgi:hypothetical protein
VDTVAAYEEELKLIQIGTILTFALCSIWFFLLGRRLRQLLSSKFRAVFEYLGILSPEKAKKK